jgi:hypothetical protein
MANEELTRRSLHAVAELVLAGPQHRRTGEIALVVEPAGFRTLTEPQLSVDGTDLVAGDRRIPIDGSTCAELAAAAGVDAGPPKDLYPDGSGVAPGDTLHLDASATAWIEQCWASGAEALRRLAPGEQPILWPEHFDVGIELDGVSYGVSPGDGYLDEPYAYVNPGKHADHPYWNAPFGSARPMHELSDTDAVYAYFAEGQRSR